MRGSAVLAAMTGVLVGLAAWTFHFAKGTSYLTDDPTACANCHVMRDQFDGWQKASHHGVATCNDCHVPRFLPFKYYEKAENGFWHSLKFTLGDYKEPIRIRAKNARILQANCVRCHKEMVRCILPGRGDDPDCVSCHRAAGHGP